MLSASDPSRTIHPSSLGTRESVLYEQALEAVYRRPYAVLVGEAADGGRGGPADLLYLGRRLFLDFVRLARGEISGIQVPVEIPGRQDLYLAPTA